MNKVQTYTFDKLAANLLLAEEHAKDFSLNESSFCLECLEKHLRLIEALCGEALGFFENPSLFSEIAEWSAKVRSQLDDATDESMKQVAAQSREHRKNLVDAYGECVRCKVLNLRRPSNAEDGFMHLTREKRAYR